jgi:hypothetical protein
MSGTHRNSIAVQVVADLFGTEAIHHKRNDARLFFGGADDAQAGNLLQPFGRVEQQPMLVTRDVFHSGAVDVVDGSAEPDREPNRDNRLPSECMLPCGLRFLQVNERSWLGFAENRLWISISGFESLGAANT